MLPRGYSLQNITIMRIQTFIIGIAMTFSLLPLRAQQIPAPVAGELIVRLKAGEQPEALLPAARSHTWHLSHHRSLSRRFNIHLFTTTAGDEQLVLDWLLSQSTVESAQLHYPLGFRSSPNDPDFINQWTLEKIAIPAVWEETTGGLTALGDTIVIALLDNGFEPAHPDLAANIWRNRGEVPNDGLDNDNNGYIDDYQGWNFVGNGPEHNIYTSHGQSVAGIMGARGNNQTGVAGINWHVKIMLLNVREVPQIIEAYDYVIEQRRRYNASQGQEGALVVVTNASFGQSRIFCSQQPVWGGMYDLLGEEGILTGAATDNFRYDVDMLGDMPSTCESEYIIVTLNTSETDGISQSSAYGAVSIDLGTPGDGSFTTKGAAGYGTFGSNSAAAPHLSGAIALLYSLPCEQLAARLRSQPAETARLMRRFVLEGVDPAAALQNKTVSGGRLNVFNSMVLAREACGVNTDNFALLNLFPNPVTDLLTITYETEDYAPLELALLDVYGRQLRTEPLRVPYFSEKKHLLSVSGLPQGAYFLRLTSGKNSVLAKFIISR
jgi:hypothetical protein